MKVFAKFLTVITSLILLAGGYLFWAADLKATSDGVLVESAADRIDAFQGIRESANLGSDHLTLFTERVDDNARQFIFLTYTLRIRNLNALPAEWLQLELIPQNGDVLLVKPTVEDIPAFSERLATAVLMTDRNTPTHLREARLHYYLYGHEFSVPVQLGRQ